MVMQIGIIQKLSFDYFSTQVYINIKQSLHQKLKNLFHFYLCISCSCFTSSTFITFLQLTTYV